MPSPERCAACAAPLDLARYARCDQCRGARYCVDCARRHVCSRRCLTNGCRPGLCVRLVRDGVTDVRFGVHE